MTEFANQPFEDQDFRDILAEIEDHEENIQSIMSAAMGKAADIRKQIKNAKKRAKAELQIPTAILNASLKTRKLERKLDEIAKDVPEELIELWSDVAGQFSFLAPTEDEEVIKDEPVAKRAAKRAKKAAEKRDAAEIEEGGKVLDDMAAVH